MAVIVSWIQAFATSIGGVGLFFIAFLDSSFLSLPEVKDVVLIMMAIENKELMPFYALMTTLGSIAGCLVLYVLGARGGEMLIRSRFAGPRLDRAMELSARYGMFAILVPAILPPPSPFKVFVLLAGVSRMPILKFILVVTLGRGLRYFVEGLLAVRYGDQAIDLIKQNTQTAWFILIGLMLVGGYIFYLLRIRLRNFS